MDFLWTLVKNTQNLTDFLKDKPFAGNVRPNVYVRTLKLGKDEVDVIIIKNGYHTPYYLTEKFRSLFPNSIYVRVEDTNTSRDKSADIGNIEYLWKKRFRIDKPPIERVEYFLKDKKQWDSFDKGEIYGYYYRLYPEYNICKKISEDRTGYEFYLFTQIFLVICATLFYNDLTEGFFPPAGILEYRWKFCDERDQSAHRTARFFTASEFSAKSSG